MFFEKYNGILVLQRLSTLHIIHAEMYLKGGCIFCGYLQKKFNSCDEDTVCIMWVNQNNENYVSFESSAICFTWKTLFRAYDIL